MTVNPPRPIRFVVTPDDIVDVTRAYAGHRQRAGMIVGVALLAVAATAFVLTAQPLWLGLGAIGVFAAASPFLRTLDRALARANPHARIGEQCEMTFDEDGLRFNQGAVSGVLRWSAVTEVRVGDDAILLLKDRALLASIPRRAFGSPAQVNVTVEFLKAKASS